DGENMLVRAQNGDDEESRQADADLDETVSPQRPRPTRAAPADDRVPRREAEEDGRQRGRDGGRGRAEERDDLPRPEHFVDQRRRARNEDQRMSRQQDTPRQRGVARRGAPR